MQITESDQTKMLMLLGSINKQANKVHSVSVIVDDDFHYRKGFVDLIMSSDWPQAVSPELIADNTSEADKFLRADGILAVMIGSPLADHSMLDFGCGEGHVAKRAAEQKAKVVVGYDMRAQWNQMWSGGNLVLTTNWQDVVDNGLYDFILAYDVIDHIESESQIDVLKKMLSVLMPNGSIHLRCHPWTSRHATHLYRQLNKAYVHMLLSDLDIAAMGLSPQPTIKIIYPQNQYKEWFRAANLNIKNTNITNNIVEPFFKEGDVAMGIKAHWIGSMDPDLASGHNFPEYQLSLQFIDYVLIKKHG